MKRPAFQFYPGDWMRSTDLRCCSVGARGLWIDMICLMHEGRPYGHLKVGEKVILPANLASITGATLSDVEGWLHELTQTGVCSVGHDGCIFSRRMIRDEELRQVRAAGGSKGGNPALLGKKEGETRLTSEDKQNTTPSSSSAFASSSASASSVSKEQAPAKPSRTSSKSVKTAMPENFTVSEKVWEWAKGKGFSDKRVSENYANFVLAAGAKGYKYKDWDCALMKAISGNWAKVVDAKQPSRHNGFADRDYNAGGKDDGTF